MRTRPYQSLLLIICASMLSAGSAPADRIEQEERVFELPLTLTLPEGRVAFFQGHEFKGEITFYRDSADTIRATNRIVDVAVWPRPLKPLTPASLKMLKEIYGSVPYVIERIVDGSEEAWRKATDEYKQIQKRMRFEISTAYWDVLDIDPEDVSGALDAAVGALAPYLVLLDEELGSYEIVAPDIRLHWKGHLAGSELVLLNSGQFSMENPRDRDRTLDEEAAQRALSVFHRFATSERFQSATMVYNHRGLHVVTDSLAEAATRQIESAAAGGEAAGPLHEIELQEILSRRTKGGQ